ncbi:hypothetical protein CGMCC3_g13715 [Colletotrichum fructicola]|nr:uncharacterized protein CGMCC3_g13715 [Colletotrichum fructicola]KAE9570116.1 hypothetical protein CGMCC3_g13715 [Colletotrichum fructicola]
MAVCIPGHSTAHPESSSTITITTSSQSAPVSLAIQFQIFDTQITRIPGPTTPGAGGLEPFAVNYPRYRAAFKQSGFGTDDFHLEAKTTALPSPMPRHVPLPCLDLPLPEARPRLTISVAASAVT